MFGFFSKVGCFQNEEFADNIDCDSVPNTPGEVRLQSELRKKLRHSPSLDGVIDEHLGEKQNSTLQFGSHLDVSMENVSPVVEVATLPTVVMGKYEENNNNKLSNNSLQSFLPV